MIQVDASGSRDLRLVLSKLYQDGSMRDRRNCLGSLEHVIFWSCNFRIRQLAELFGKNSQTMSLVIFDCVSAQRSNRRLHVQQLLLRSARER